MGLRPCQPPPAASIVGSDAQREEEHRFPNDDIMQAYDVFARPAQTGALKVVLSR
jgi:hypothetical protein